MNELFQLIKQTVSFKGFIDVECPEYNLTPYWNGKYKGKCPLHHEVDGESFLLDEISGKCSCIGKCNLKGADICQVAALLWQCTNKEALKSVYANREQYGPKQLLETRNKVRKKEPTVPPWPWRLHLQPFPKDAIANLAQLRGIPKLGVRRAIGLGLLWYLPTRKWTSGEPKCSGDKGLGKRPRIHYHTIQASWVITDAEREQAIRRRMDGLPWDGGAKSKLLPGCTGKAEIGLQEALAFDDGGEIIVVEGGPDLLAALGYFPTRGVICMASVNTDFSLTARIALRGKEVAIVSVTLTALLT
jgi:hypothetical protein